MEYNCQHAYLHEEICLPEFVRAGLKRFCGTINSSSISSANAVRLLTAAIIVRPHLLISN